MAIIKDAYRLLTPSAIGTNGAHSPQVIYRWTGPKQRIVIMTERRNEYCNIGSGCTGVNHALEGEPMITSRKRHDGGCVGPHMTIYPQYRCVDWISVVPDSVVTRGSLRNIAHMACVAYPHTHTADALRILKHIQSIKHDFGDKPMVRNKRSSYVLNHTSGTIHRGIIVKLSMAVAHLIIVPSVWECCSATAMHRIGKRRIAGIPY